uniref:Uncharacterized protein LOC117310239 n=1 Tax=Tursiops truncatus TaxID=9739 RepID=A0A6J3QSA6_TURTR|nr:uncharacterized protein LOC117310239 [Tursiops truncatus]
MHKYIWYMLDDSEARKEKAVSAPHYKESEGVAHDLPRGVECWLCGVFHCLPCHTRGLYGLCCFIQVPEYRKVISSRLCFPDLSQIEKRLGSFSADSSHYIKEFRYLSQAYDLTWHDISVVLSSTLTPDERERIQTAAGNHADQVHLTDNSMPVGATAVPGTDPDWTYQDGQDGRRKRDLIQCLLAGMQAAAHKYQTPYTLLSHISPSIAHFTVLDLKDAFFTIPLHPDSYFLFAFTWTDPDTHTSSQLTWTVLPQGFRDSPHLFGQALARDPTSCSLTPSTLLQYVDDLLLCSPSLSLSRQHTADLLNYLGPRGYRVSPAKAQLSVSSITYLGLHLTATTNGLTADRTRIIRELQPLETAEQILAFLGLIGFFWHWIPNFALLAKPLYLAAKETPQGLLTSPSAVR